VAEIKAVVLTEGRWVMARRREVVVRRREEAGTVRWRGAGVTVRRRGVAGMAM